MQQWYHAVAERTILDNTGAKSRRSRRHLKCPSCGSELQLEVTAPVIQCPSCGEELQYTLLHRLLMIVVGLVLAWSLARALGAQHAVYSLLFFLLAYPAMVLAWRLISAVVLPKYERRSSGITTLFRR